MSLLGVEIVGAIGGRPERRMIGNSGVSIDSRTLRQGQVFFALEGQRADGHQYAVQALQKGAAAAVVHRDVQVPGEFRDRVVRVKDTLQALGDTARCYRRKWGGTVIAVTGSNGKTTTREMLYHVLSGVMPCKRSPKSFNTNIGVSLTLFQAEDADQVMVVEMGTNAPGEIRELAAIAEPELGVITNIGPSHLEGLGSEEGVARAKAELLQGLGPSGTAFLSRNDKWFGFLKKCHPGAVVSFGFGPDADFCARPIRQFGNGYWFLVDPGVEVHLPVPGMHNVHNAVAALAVARHLEVDMQAAAARLAGFRLPPMRYEVEKINGLTLVSDCYNANPSSMRAALAAFADMPVRGRRVAVLGDMMELGAHSDTLHAELGAGLVHYKLDLVWAIGNYGECVVQAARKHGLANRAFHAATLNEAALEICDALREGDAALVKGSRGMVMDKLVQKLRERAAVTP